MLLLLHATPCTNPVLQATWNVHHVLKHLLAQEDATMDVYLCQQLQTAPNAPGMAAALRNARFAAKTARDKAEAVQQGQALGIKSNGVVKAKPTRPPKMGKQASSAAEPQQQKEAAAAPAAPTAAPAAAVAAQGGSSGSSGSSSGGSYTMWDLYQMYWLPFGDVLSAMESAGVRVDRYARVGLDKQRGISTQHVDLQHVSGAGAVCTGFEG